MSFFFSYISSPLCIPNKATFSQKLKILHMYNWNVLVLRMEKTEGWRKNREEKSGRKVRPSNYLAVWHFLFKILLFKHCHWSGLCSHAILKADNKINLNVHIAKKLIVQVTDVPSRTIIFCPPKGWFQYLSLKSIFKKSERWNKVD